MKNKDAFAKGSIACRVGIWLLLRIFGERQYAMIFFGSILFWLGIVFLVDGSLALLFQEKWQKWVGGLDIPKIALVEIGVGVALLAVHYILGRGL